MCSSIKENPNKYVMNFDMFFSKENETDYKYYENFLDPVKHYWITYDIPKGSIITTDDQKKYTATNDNKKYVKSNNNYRSYCYSYRYLKVDEQNEGIYIGDIMGIYIPDLKIS